MTLAIPGASRPASLIELALGMTWSRPATISVVGTCIREV
jgi:hypothetical protein